MSTSTSKKTRSQRQKQSLQERLFRQDHSVTIDEIHNFLKNKEYNYDLYGDVSNFFHSHKISKEEIVPFLNDGQILDLWKELCIVWFHYHYHNIENASSFLQDVAREITNEKLQSKIYQQILEYYILTSSKISESDLTLAKTFLERIPQSIRSPIKERVEKQQALFKKKQLRMSMMKKPIHQQEDISVRIQHGDPMLTLTHIYDFLKRNTKTEEKVVFSILSHSNNLFREKNPDKVVLQFLNDNDMKGTWKERLIYLFVNFLNLHSQKKEEGLLNLAQKVESKELQTYIYKKIIEEYIFDSEIEKANKLIEFLRRRELHDDDEADLKKMEQKIKRKIKKMQVMKESGGGGSPRVPSLHSPTNSGSTGLLGSEAVDMGRRCEYQSSPKHKQPSPTNSDSSTGLLGLGAVAVGVFLVVLLGVRYRK